MAVMCEICKCSQWLDSESGKYLSDCDCTCCEHFPEIEYCNACHKLAHKDNELCPEFAHTCNLCSNEIVNGEGLDMAPWGATCKDCLIDLGVSITCDLCGIKSKDYSNGGFWNCLCETCWNTQKNRI